MGRTKINRLGEISYTKWNVKMEIVKYDDTKNITIKLYDKDNTILKSQYNNFLIGNIHSPYDKTVYKVGFIGKGDYKCYEDNKNTIQYEYWVKMLQRCYDDKFIKKQPSYIECSVCEDWHNFQTFASWFDKNYYMVGSETISLDKDILYKGNKIYSPNTCVFVPKRINNLFTKGESNRGKCLIGVTYNKEVELFHAQCSVLKKRKHLGYFNKMIDAFLAYKNFKEQYIKQVADEYKDKIPTKLYDAMYKWEVEITD